MSTEGSLATILASLQPTFTIDPVGIIVDPAAAVGTWAASHSITATQADNAFNSSNAQNDSISFDVALTQGNWNIGFSHVMAPTAAIATVTINGTQVGTVDFWNGSTLTNQQHVIPGISIGTPGVYRVSITAATRNASSTGWTLQIARIQFRRTDNAGLIYGPVGILTPQYKFIGAPIQNTGAGFQPIVAPPHTPVGIDSIVTTGTSTGTITVNYAALGATGIVTFFVVPDETFVKSGIQGGASVGLQSAIINCATNGVQTDPTTLNTTNFPNGNFWVGGIFKTN